MQDALRRLVEKLLGASPGLHIIITTRTAFTLPAAASCGLQCMTQQDAVELLRAICRGRHLPDPQARRIAAACGCNPLELALVGGMMGSGSCTPQVRRGDSLFVCCSWCVVIAQLQPDSCVWQWAMHGQPNKVRP